MPRELRARVVSSVILAPAALLVTWAQEPVFAGMVAAGGVILAREWTRMADPEGPDLSYALAVGGAAGATILASARLIEMSLAWAVALALAAAAAAAPRRRALDAGLGAAYIAIPCALLVWLRLEGEDGAWTVTFLFVSVWGADIGAYLAGKVVGGPRLWTQISPTKTWAGLVGGVGLAAVFGLALSGLAGFNASWAAMAAGAAALGAAGLCGDLLESAMKRRYGVKDTGSLIPGHGGLMDRVDGLMTATVALALWSSLARFA